MVRVAVRAVVVMVEVMEAAVMEAVTAVVVRVAVMVVVVMVEVTAAVVMAEVTEVAVRAAAMEAAATAVVRATASCLSTSVHAAARGARYANDHFFEVSWDAFVPDTHVWPGHTWDAASTCRHDSFRSGFGR